MGMLLLRMSEGEAKRYWVRTEQGRVWGPFPVDQLARLKGQITEKAQVALDGRSFRPVSEFPELQGVLVQRAEVRRAEPPAARERAPEDAPHVGPALRAMFSAPPQGSSPAPSASPRPAPPVVAPTSAPANAPPAAPEARRRRRRRR